VFDEQTFLRENGQCLTYRRARHPEPLGEWCLGNALAGGEFSLQDHLPYAN
jgi:hypothetical protein